MNNECNYESNLRMLNRSNSFNLLLTFISEVRLQLKLHENKKKEERKIISQE